ncbi:YjiH family protein [Shouchella sp. JSM 1781072]|uniref:YjiH family protein n=1 Tax=Bacillaceae TaxID=186817 RepID=UPI000C084AD3|nr:MULTISPECIES: YjiH family protein [Bacillaceae]UTR05549.1 YjiH family protein [Alkalihalobacillus sp. LMS6]
MEQLKQQQPDSNHKKNHEQSTRSILTFLLPSLLGAFLFLVPFKINDNWTVLIGYAAGRIEGSLEAILPMFLLTIILTSGVVSLLSWAVKPALIMENTALKALFYTSLPWTIIRVVGALFALMVMTETGSEVVYSAATGGTIFTDLLPVLAVWSVVMGLLMPLLLEYGLMEWLGTLAKKVMRPLFNLPGRASVDSLASWMGNNMMSILITINQYENGYYTKRESAVIVTNFTITSIGFSLIIAEILSLSERFVPFYLTVLAGVFVAAFICPRIPPLSKMSHTYAGEQPGMINETVASGSLWSQAFKRGVTKAAHAPKTTQVFKKGAFNALDIWFGMLPLVMAIGTIALIIAEFTPVFTYLSYPLVPVLEWMNIPEAAEAAPALLVGFADMFLPAILGAGIESELTRFVIGAVSLIQLVYMSEIGVMLMRSSIPISFWQLLIIFIQRTIIAIPVVVLIAHVIIF